MSAAETGEGETSGAEEVVYDCEFCDTASFPSLAKCVAHESACTKNVNATAILDRGATEDAESGGGGGAASEEKAVVAATDGGREADAEGLGAEVEGCGEGDEGRGGLGGMGGQDVGAEEDMAAVIDKVIEEQKGVTLGAGVELQKMLTRRRVLSVTGAAPRSPPRSGTKSTYAGSAGRNRAGDAGRRGVVGGAGGRGGGGGGVGEDGEGDGADEVDVDRGAGSELQQILTRRRAKSRSAQKASIGGLGGGGGGGEAGGGGGGGDGEDVGAGSELQQILTRRRAKSRSALATGGDGGNNSDEGDGSGGGGGDSGGGGEGGDGRGVTTRQIGSVLFADTDAATDATPASQEDEQRIIPGTPNTSSASTPISTPTHLQASAGNFSTPPGGELGEANKGDRGGGEGGGDSAMAEWQRKVTGMSSISERFEGKLYVLCTSG